MSYCPAQTVQTSETKQPESAAVAYPVKEQTPDTTDELCGQSPVVTPPTPEPPPGPPPPPPGEPDPEAPPPPVLEGLRWAGPWESGKFYRKAVAGCCDDNPNAANADVVRIDEALFVCIQDHTSSDANKPQMSDFNGPVEWPSYWQLMMESKTVAQETEKSLVDNLFDWFSDIENWDVSDWLKLAAGAAGIIVAGAAISNMMEGPASSATETDSRYNGSPSYIGDYDLPGLREVVESICADAGIESYDASLLSNDIKLSFAVSQQTSYRTILDNLSRAFQFDMVKSGSTLKFVPRGQPIVKTLTFDDMGWNDRGESSAPIAVRRVQSVDLPRKVTLTYYAADLDYNTYTQQAEIPTFKDGNQFDLSVPFVLDHEVAKAAVDTLLIGAHLARTQYQFSTNFDHIDLEPGDNVVLQINGAGETVVARVIQVEEGSEGILNMICEDAGAIDDGEPVIIGGVEVGTKANSYIGTGTAPQLPPAVVNPAPVISEAGLIFIDPPVMNSDDQNPRAYALIHGYGEPGWTGATLWMSKDNEQSYQQVGSAAASATLGIVETPMANGDYHGWDNITQVTVRLRAGQLQSKTEEQVISGQNWALIGNELIGFQVATLTAPNTYVLSKLLRGRKGTEWATGAHQENELFALLDSTPVPVSIPVAERGSTYFFKAVTNGSDLSKATAQQVQIIGTNTVPWTVANLKAVKNPTNKAINITWTERPRFNNALRDMTEIDHDPDWGGWLVAIYNGDTVVRQEVVYNNVYVYTLSMQVTDFTVEQTAPKISVTQVSNRYGGGRITVVNN